VKSFQCASEIVSLKWPGGGGGETFLGNHRQYVLGNNTRMQYKGHEAERSVLRLEIMPVSDITLGYITCF
jgi:hypothetical protein